MSKINGKPAPEWIEENRPENGVFRVYWKDVIGPHDGGVTFDENESEGLRWEWYYKDGKMADGVSKGWFPNGQLKQSRIWKNGVQDGIWTEYYENGQKDYEQTYKDGKRDGLWIKFSQKKTGGEKMEERTYKNGKKDGLFTFWYENGQKMYEGTFKDGKPDGPFTVWYENGQKSSEKTYKDGKFISEKRWNEDGSVKE